MGIPRTRTSGCRQCWAGKTPRSLLAPLEWFAFASLASSVDPLTTIPSVTLEIPPRREEFVWDLRTFVHLPTLIRPIGTRHSCSVTNRFVAADGTARTCRQLSEQPHPGSQRASLARWSSRRRKTSRKAGRQEG